MSVTKEQIGEATIEMRKAWKAYCDAPETDDADAVERLRFRLAENRVNDLVALYLAEQAKAPTGSAP